MMYGLRRTLPVSHVNLLARWRRSSAQLGSLNGDCTILNGGATMRQVASDRGQ